MTKSYPIPEFIGQACIRLFQLLFLMQEVQWCIPAQGIGMKAVSVQGRRQKNFQEGVGNEKNKTEKWHH